MDGHWAAAVAAAAVATAYPAASLQACGVRVAVMNDLDMITGYDHTEGEGEITRKGGDHTEGEGEITRRERGGSHGGGGDHTEGGEITPTRHAVAFSV